MLHKVGQGDLVSAPAGGADGDRTHDPSTAQGGRNVTPRSFLYGLFVGKVAEAMLQEALAKGNVSEAARLLKVTRNTLRYRIGKYNLKASEESS